MFDDGLPALRDVIKQHDLKAKRSFGQNFLLDFNITRKIAQLAGARSGVNFIEIGPGPGGLTRALLYEGVDQLTVVERDERLRPVLGEIAERYPGALKIKYGDALRLDLSSFVASPFEIVGNLPYNIATALLVGWLEDPWPAKFRQLTLMFQEEVAERLVANPGEKAYGRLSALTNWRCDAEIAYRLPQSAFTPAPKVNSAIVILRPKASLEYNPSVETFSRVTAAAFGQRRKMLRQSLKGLAMNLVDRLNELDISQTARAGDIGWQDYCRLALNLEET